MITADISFNIKSHKIFRGRFFYTILHWISQYSDTVSLSVAVTVHDDDVKKYVRYVSGV